MLTIEERKRLLFRRIKDGLSEHMLACVPAPLALGVQGDSSAEPNELDQYLDDLLLTAKAIIFEIRVPYPSEDWVIPEDVEMQYRMLQVQIAVEICTKEGAEGQTSHSEAGISRSYSSADVSVDLINRITPLCGTFK